MISILIDKLFLLIVDRRTTIRRLPPLKSLQSFEAAARWLSFSKAADELSVTPAAVSQQIKQLESYLGIPLFRRMTRAVQLTEEAKTVLPLVTEGFDRLAEAVERLAREEEAGLLTVSSVPTLAIKWLVHHLIDFSNKYPDIDVRLDASLETREFDRDGIDVSIRLGMGDYPGLNVARIFGEEVSPVCSPKLLGGARPLRVLEDLKNHRLLHVDWGTLTRHSPDWRMWAKAAGIEGIDVDRGPSSGDGQVIDVQFGLDACVLGPLHLDDVDQIEKQAAELRGGKARARSNTSGAPDQPREHSVGAN